MLRKKTLVITLTWLLLVAYLVTCSYAAKAKPAERVVHPQVGIISSFQKKISIACLNCKILKNPMLMRCVSLSLKGVAAAYLISRSR